MEKKIINDTTLFFDEPVKKNFQNFQIEIYQNLDSIIISIFDSNKKYESNFSYENLQKNKLLRGADSIDEIIEFISDLIDQNHVSIENDNENIKLTLISTLPKYPNVELIINVKQQLFEENSEKLSKQFEDLSNQNEELKKIYKKKFDSILEKITAIENENNLNKNEINKQKNIIEDYKIKISKLEEKITQFEEKENKMKFELFKTNFRLIKYFNIHNDNINAISVFPSGNIISVSKDKSIKILNQQYYILQTIENAHSENITYIDIKDENNFVTCSWDRSIKTWIKNEKEFKLNKNIVNAHNCSLNKVIYYLNNHLISCSNYSDIKIWEENNNEYQLISTLEHSNVINSILLLNDKNILVSSGMDGTKFWNLKKEKLKNITLIEFFEEVKCNCWNGICRINENKIVIGGDILFVISLAEQKIINEIKIPFKCYGINTIKENEIFLVVGDCGDIMFYKSENCENFHIIKNAHTRSILGITKINNILIATYSFDKFIKIWSY